MIFQKVDEETKTHLLILALLMVSSILAVWTPFLLSDRTDVIFRYWDGPSYVTVAYSLYAIENPVYQAYGFGPDFYAAHFPAYPLAIRLLSFAGYFNAMLLATVVFAVLSVLAFYFLAREFLSTSNAFLLSIVFVFFPVRWLAYHSIGASEPLFLFAVLSAVFFFHRKQLGKASAFGVLATLTRINGVLLFFAFVVALLWQDDRKQLTLRNMAMFSLMPLALVALFAFYAFEFGDFWAYFKINAGYLKGPFSAITSFGGPQAGEFIVLLFALYGLGAIRLWQRKRFDLLTVALVFIVPVLFLAHNDLSRYLLPAAPFALLLGFDDVITVLLQRKAGWLVFAVIVFGAMLYVWDTLPQNLMPQDAFERLASLTR